MFMIITKRIKLRNINYYIKCDCEYKKDKLCLKHFHHDYFDGGDLSVLIEKIEAKYNEDTYKKYDNNIWFLADSLYIYDNIPFISGVGDYYVDNENIVYSASYITKEELDRYIKENNIEMNDSSNFKLWDERTWNVN